MKSNVEIIIDWLQFTIPKKSHVSVIIEVLRLELNLFEKLPKGKLGYKRQLAYENISVLYDGNDDMGVHVIISGKGCRLYETYYSLLNLIAKITEFEGKLTRIDLAMDDYTGEIIQFDKLLNDIKKGNIVSKWKSSTEIIKRDLNGNITGQTISVGSRSSNTFLRIYDKAMEQKIKGIWNRIEIEIKKENAEKVQKLLNENTAGKIMKGILKNYLRIVIPNKKDKNKSRWKTAPYWEKIIENVEKIKLTQKSDEKTIEELRQWIERQVGASLAVITIDDGGSIDFICDIIEKSAKKLKPKHKKMLGGK